MRGVNMSGRASGLEGGVGLGEGIFVGIVAVVVGLGEAFVARRGGTGSRHDGRRRR